MTKTDTTAQKSETPENSAKPEKTQRKLFPPWSPITAFFMVIAAYLGASIIGELVLEFYGSLQHWSTRQISDWLTSSTYAQFTNSIMVYGLMALAIYVFVHSYKVSLKGLGLVRPRLKDLGIALLGIPVYIGGYVVIEIAAKSLFPAIDVNQEQQLGFPITHSPAAQLLIFFSLVVLPPLVEELLMRGFLFTSLLKRLRLIPTVIITSMVFASAHLQLGSGAPPLWIAAIDTFTLSLVLCYMRYKTGSLWPGIFLHAMKNGVAFLAIFVFHSV
jgi:membrane protease YdiL (CAAX protease family)